MRRWNGWGDEAVSAGISAGALELLSRLLGPSTSPRDATLEEALRAVPPSRAPESSLWTTDAEARLRHARGQSLPDWVALRSGRIGALPDAVAFPETDDDVRRLLAAARGGALRLIPYGGGTSVAGHVNPIAGEAPVVTVDMARTARFEGLDETSRLATFGAGILGPDLESALQAHGHTLGHFPQSFEHSTLGGWIATRSSGQESMGYGRIERLFAGGHVETPLGSVDLAPVPASAAGPDLRELVLGSEGRLGFVTRAVVRVRAVPERDEIRAVVFPSWDDALAAARAIAQARPGALSMLRVSGPAETESALAMAGPSRALGLLTRAWEVLGLGSGRCLLVTSAAGDRRAVAAALGTALDLARAHNGVLAPGAFGREWRKQRFRAPYLRNALWEKGYAVDTLETAASWDAVPRLVPEVEAAIRTAAEEAGERIHVFTHLSHAYPTGSSAYTTILFRVGEPDTTLDLWRRMKTAASDAILSRGGTISHQHGVGLDHIPWAERERGPAGSAALRGALAALDPDGVMNPGKLL